MPLTVETLARAVADGARPSFLCFPDWGGAPPAGWLAAWTPTPFATSAGRFGSAEQHFSSFGSEDPVPTRLAAGDWRPSLEAITDSHGFCRVRHDQ
jgi:hypothetical protein